MRHGIATAQSDVTQLEISRAFASQTTTCDWTSEELIVGRSSARTSSYFSGKEEIKRWEWDERVFNRNVPERDIPEKYFNELDELFWNWTNRGQLQSCLNLRIHGIISIDWILFFALEQQFLLLQNSTHQLQLLLKPHFELNLRVDTSQYDDSTHYWVIIGQTKCST